MTSCPHHSEADQNNGLITKIWGPPAWVYMHAVTFGYPVEPTDEHKKNYKEYFFSTGNVLPCKYCRESYQKFIREGKTALTDNDLMNRDTLTAWFYRVHNAVNNKLGVDYGITLEDVRCRYESFRAKCGANSTGCVSPLDYKAFSFKKLNLMDCPVVKFPQIIPFIKVAMIRKLPDEYFSYLSVIEKNKADLNNLKKDKSWELRNQICQNIIKKMRESGTPNIETSGEWEGTPTIEELKLSMFMCSTLSQDERKQTLDKILTNKIYQNYIRNN